MKLQVILTCLRALLFNFFIRVISVKVCVVFLFCELHIIDREVYGFVESEKFSPRIVILLEFFLFPLRRG